MTSDNSIGDHSPGDYVKYVLLLFKVMCRLALIALKIGYLIYKLVGLILANTRHQTKNLLIINLLAIYFIIEVLPSNFILNSFLAISRVFVRSH